MLIPTKKLVLRDKSTPPVNPDKRKVRYQSKSLGYPSFNQIVPPMQGSPADPRTTGATVVVFSTSTLTNDLAIVALPASGWVATGPNSYKYTGAPGETIRSAVYKPDFLSFKGGGPTWSYTLNESQQGDVGMLFLQGGQLLCSVASPRFPTSNYDRPDKFVAGFTDPPFFCPSPI